MDEQFSNRLQPKDTTAYFKQAEISRHNSNDIEYFSENYNCSTVDGVRIKFGDGWGLVRSSNTQPVIVCRFEANSPERKDEIMNLVLGKLKEFGNLELGGH